MAPAFRLPRAARRTAPGAARHGLRLTLLALVVGALAPGMAAPAHAAAAAAGAAVRSYEVPAGELGAALSRFADQAGVTVLFDAQAVSGRQSPGLRGTYAPAAGIERLLEGSGLAAEDNGDGTFVVRPRGQAAIPRLSPIAVQAPLPAGPAWASSASREALEAAAVRGWSDVGRRLDPGLAFNRRTGSVNLRGLQDGRVATRIDGIRLSWLDDGARGVMGGLNAVDFESLSRLDVVRGAGSASAGSGALAGTVELRTLGPDDLLPGDRRLGLLARTDYDSADDSHGAHAALAGRVGEDTAWLVQAGVRRGHELENRGDVGGLGAARTEADPADTRQRSLLVKLQQQVARDHRLTLTGEYFKREEDAERLYQQGPGTSYLAGANTGHDDARRERVSLDYDYRAPGSGGPLDEARATLYWQRLRLDNGQAGERQADARAAIIPGDPFRYGFPSGAYARSNSIQESIFGASAEASRRFAGTLAQKWTVGAEWYGTRTEQYSGGYDNCPFIPPGLPAPFGPRSCDMLHTNQADMPRAKGNQWAFWLRDEITLADGRYTVTPALRYDRYRHSPQDTGAYADNPNAAELPPDARASRVSPSLLASWQAREDLSFYAQYAHAFKAPTATQLYTNYGGPGTYLRVGNPYLKPETSRGWEIGTRWGGEHLGGAFAAFHTRYRDFIDNNVPLTPDSPQWQPGWDTQYPLGVTGMVNRARVRMHGVEASAHWRFAPGWRAWGAVAWTDGKDQTTGQHLNSVAPLKAIVGLGYAQQQWGADLSLTAAARRSKVEYPDAAPDAPNPDFQAPGYGVVDFTAFWRPAAIDGLRVQLGVFNVFDRKYWEAINVPTAGALAIPRPLDWYTEPGRSVRVSLTYQY